MTKVEELREGLIKTLTDAWGGHNAAAIMMADNIIAAAHAEGVAEGAEQAKKAIWKEQLIGYRVQLYPFPPDERSGLRVETEVDGKQYVMVPVASVLVPTKEVAG